MAYNSYSNNKDFNKPFEPNVYTAYRWNNAESSVDKTCMTTAMWKQMMKVGIFPVKESNGDNISFDMENNKADAVRIQTSVLNALEKKVLVWLAERIHHHR